MSKNDKRTNSYMQNTTQKTYDWATRPPLKTRCEVKYSERPNSICSTSDAKSFYYCGKHGNMSRISKGDLWLHQMEYIYCYLRHKYCVMVNQPWWRPCNIRNDDFSGIPYQLHIQVLLECSEWENWKQISFVESLPLMSFDFPFGRMFGVR